MALRRAQALQKAAGFQTGLHPEQYPGFLQAITAYQELHRDVSPGPVLAAVFQVSFWDRYSLHHQL